MFPSRSRMTSPRGKARAVALVLLLASALGASDPPDLRERARAAIAQTSGEVGIAGLQREVEVLRDRWGVAHVYAQTLDDLFLAQGFVAAQDRLWQMEMWRRTAE